MANESDYPAKYQLEDGSGAILLETGDYLAKEIQGYPELVSSDGAICYFRFDEASGNFADLLGGRTGTATGAAMAYAQTGALVGDTNTSLGLSNTNQFVSVPGSTALTPAGNSNNMTAEIWADISNNATLSSAIFATMIEWSFSANPLAADSTGDRIQVGALAQNSVGGSLVNASAQFTLTTTDWHLYTVVFDASVSKTYLYFDGGLLSGFPVAWTGTPKTWTAGVLKIGGDGGNIVNGRIDEFALYPTALTGEQVARHYRCGVQYFDSGIGMNEPSQYPQLIVQ